MSGYCRDSRAGRLARLDLRGGPKRGPVGAIVIMTVGSAWTRPRPSVNHSTLLPGQKRHAVLVSLRYAGAKSRSVCVVRRLRVDSRAAAGAAAPRHEAVVMTGRTSPESGAGESGPAFPHVHAEIKTWTRGGPGRSRRRCGTRRQPPCQPSSALAAPERRRHERVQRDRDHRDQQHFVRKRPPRMTNIKARLEGAHAAP